MTAVLLRAPVGAGKTTAVIHKLQMTAQHRRFAKIWVLLPSARQEDAFRAQLAAQLPVSAPLFNIEFFNFYSLYSHLLNRVGQPQRELEAVPRLRLLRELLKEQAPQLQCFAPIAHTPGLAAVLGDFIYELKQNMVTPSAWRAAAQTAKDRDIATLYEVYQAHLQKHDLIDREGEGWLALKQVSAHRVTDVQLLIVDGFDQFNPLQRQLLAALAQGANETLITLPQAPAGVGRRFEEAAQLLQTAFGNQLPVQELPHPQGAASDELRSLRDASFAPDGQSVSPQGSLLALEAATPAQETAAVLRQIKALLLNQQARPDEIMIALRDWERYGRYLAAYGREYGLPLALHFGEPLSENPAVVALLKLLQLAGAGFPRRAVFDVLRSPYFATGWTAADSTALEKIANEQLVIQGREEWLAALTRCALPPPVDDERSEPTYTQMAAETAQAYATHLAAFFDRLTPPEEASLETYVHWITALIGGAASAEPDDPAPLETTSSLHMQASINAAAPDLRGRDLAALHAVQKILNSLITTQQLFEALGLGAAATVPWETFLQDLQSAIQQQAVEQQPQRSGKILVTTVTNARGLPHRFVAIPGLAQGIFPAPTPDDALYLDSERLALRERGLPLETRAEQSADDSLFYEIVCTARAGLILSRPTVENGAEWPASHLWRAVMRLYAEPPIQRFSLSAVVPAAEAATLSEVFLAAAHGLSTATPPADLPAQLAWLAQHEPERWAHLCAARAVEEGRLSRAPHDAYSGRLAQAASLAQVAAKLSPRKVWSASQFNELGTCGFYFFSKRLLKLTALTDPAEGLDAAQRGTLIHSILEDTYRHWMQSGLPIAAQHTAEALDLLHQCAAQRLADAPQRLGFRASAVWAEEQHIILRQLAALVRLDFSPDSPIVKKFGTAPRYPYRLEQPFALGAAARPIILADSAADQALLVRGYIDRIDRLGDELLVLDYKSGSTPIPTDEMGRGRNYQMMLYLLVSQALLAEDTAPQPPQAVRGGLFWHLTNQSVSGVFDVQDAQDRAHYQQAQAHLLRQLAYARNADFAAEANKLENGKCVRYCDFSQFCRISNTNRYKFQG